MGGVGCQVGGPIGGVRPAPAAVALVEKNDPIPGGVEIATMSGPATRTGAAVHHEGRLARRIAADLPIDEMAIADGQVSLIVRFDRRIHSSKFSSGRPGPPGPASGGKRG